MSALPLHFPPFTDGDEDPRRCLAPLVFQKMLMASVWCICYQRRTIPAAHISSGGLIQCSEKASCGHDLKYVTLLGWNPNHIGDGA